MSLRDDLATITTQNRKTKFQTWVDNLDTEDNAVLHEYAKDTTIPNARIADAVRRNGYNADGSTIAQWRRDLGITR